MNIEQPQNTIKAKRISIRVIAILFIFLAMLLVLGFITKEIVLDKEDAFDNSIFHFLDYYRSPALTSFFTSITFLGSINFLLPAYILLSLFFIFFKKNTRRSLNIAAIGLSSSVLLFLVKYFFQRPRPVNPLISVTGFSFPSGHSFSSFTLAGIVIYIIAKSGLSLAGKRVAGAALFIAAAMVATSRVYLHVHYASDVLAGFCLSVIWLSITTYGLSLLQGNRPESAEKT